MVIPNKYSECSMRSCWWYEFHLVMLELSVTEVIPAVNWLILRAHSDLWLYMRIFFPTSYYCLVFQNNLKLLWTVWLFLVLGKEMRQLPPLKKNEKLQCISKQNYHIFAPFLTGTLISDFHFQMNKMCPGFNNNPLKALFTSVPSWENSTSAPPPAWTAAEETRASAELLPSSLWVTELWLTWQ